MYILVYTMVTKIQKWGNSLAVRLPKSVVTKLSIKQNHRVTVHHDRSRIVVTPIKPTEITLEEIVEAITPQNRHGATDWGTSLGKEIW